MFPLILFAGICYSSLIKIVNCCSYANLGAPVDRTLLGTNPLDFLYGKRYEGFVLTSIRKPLECHRHAPWRGRYPEHHDALAVDHECTDVNE